MMQDTMMVEVTCFVRDKNKEPLLNFPIQGQYVGGVNKYEKKTDHTGHVRFKLQSGSQFKLYVYTKANTFELNATIPVSVASAARVVVLGVEHAASEFMGTLLVKIVDLDKKPVKKAKFIRRYMGMEDTKTCGIDGTKELKVLLTEPIVLTPLRATGDAFPRSGEFTFKLRRIEQQTIKVTLPIHQIETETNTNEPTLPVPLTPPNIELITIEQMKAMWPSVNASILAPIMDELNSHLVDYKLDTPLRKAHFFAQVMQEIGPYFHFEERFRYSRASNLISTFGYYRRHQGEASIDSANSRDRSYWPIIANKAYGNRADLGNNQINDGWKFRGRGLKQLTGRYNYTVFNNHYNEVWADDDVDFIRTPELLSTPKYAARSAVFFWLKHELYTIADSRGDNDEQVNRITAVINRHTNSYAERRRNFRLTARIFGSDL